MANESFSCRILDSSANVLIDSLSPNALAACSRLSSGKTQLSKIDGVTSRIFSLSNRLGSIKAVSAADKHIKSSKIFKEFCAEFLQQSKILRQLNEDNRYKDGVSAKKLLHNISTLNGHCIQELESLVPQHKLRSDFERGKNAIINSFRSDSEKFARSFVTFSKRNVAIKNEIAVFNFTYYGLAEFQWYMHRIHSVIMNVAYLFFPEFNDKNVRFDVQQTFEEAKFIYEIFHVILFHLFDNALKYTKPNSSASISTERNGDYVYVIFTMESLAYSEQEKPLLTQIGYSGLEPKKANKAGNGIGLSRVKELCDAMHVELDFWAERNSQSLISGSTYQKNFFSLKIPRSQ